MKRYDGKLQDVPPAIIEKNGIVMIGSIIDQTMKGLI